jgi:hypothetical protein
MGDEDPSRALEAISHARLNIPFTRTMKKRKPDPNPGSGAARAKW